MLSFEKFRYLKRSGFSAFSRTADKEFIREGDKLKKVSFYNYNVIVPIPTKLGNELLLTVSYMESTGWQTAKEDLYKEYKKHWNETK
jgi:hypothetical protein